MPEPFDISALGIPPDSELHTLLHACPDIEAIRFRDAEALITPDETSRDIFLILRGSCLVENRDATADRRPGRELAIVEGTVDRPVFVGEMASLGERGRSAGVRSAMNTYALRLTPAHIERIIEEFPSFTRALCRQFSKRLAEANEQLRRHQSRGTMTLRQTMLAAGSPIYAKGDPADELFQLVDGVVGVTWPDGIRRVSPVGPAPVFLDAAAYFRGGVHEEDARAETSVMLVAIDAASRAAVIHNYPELALELLQAAAP